MDNLISSESQWNPNAVSPTNDYGLAAINLRWHPEVTKAEALDPEFALRFAAQAIKDGKEDAWTVCNCYQYVKAVLGDIGSITPNSTPKNGSVAIFDYKGIPHYGIVVALKVDGFKIREANYTHCKTDTRFIKWTDPNLKGFYTPQSIGAN